MATVDILAFGAHSDDIEIGAGGTLAKHAEAGNTVVLCDLTAAELSSNGNVESRKKEAELARSRMGALERINLGISDRGLALTDENIRAIVRIIRKFQPRIVLAPYWQDRHPDHEHCSHLVREAVFSAGIRKYAPDSGEVHKVKATYYYFINDFTDPDFCLDITQFYDKKMEILQSYESQFMLGDTRISTPLNEGYFEQLRSREYLFGRKIGTGYAEGFKSRNPISVDYLG